MRDGTCPKCRGTAVYSKPQGVSGLLVDSSKALHTSYVCTTCGYVEQYLTDAKQLSGIVTRAEKLRDWIRVTG